MFQLAASNDSVLDAAVRPAAPDDATATVAVPLAGGADRRTAYSAVPPSSIVSVVGSTTTPAVSASVTRTSTPGRRAKDTEA